MKANSWKYTLTLLLSIYSIMIIPRMSNATSDLINTTQTLRDGEALLSSDGRFELRFFSPRNNPTKRYVGLRYKNLDDTFVWVANRDTPLTNTRGILKVIGPGLLVLLNETQHVIWATNTSRPARNPVAQLLDTGNIVVRESNDESPENFLWQSFEYPSDTYLHGMNFRQNLVTGLRTYMTCWKGEDDPSLGQMTWALDPAGYPQIFLKNGTSPLHRIGPWNGARFSGEPVVTSDNLPFKMVFVMDAYEVRYRGIDIDKSVITRLVVHSGGYVRHYMWVNQAGGWLNSLNMPADLCDTYRLCGVNGICVVGNTPPCGCLDGFEPANPQGWFRADWSSGCARRGNLSCGGDFFRRYPAVKLPDASNSTYNASMTLGECKKECLKNCSCTAYAQLDIRKRSGCLMWYGELVDVRSLSPNGQDIYIRMAPSESGSKDNSKKTLVVCLAILGGAILAGVSVLICCLRKRKKHGLVTKKGKIQGNNQDNDHPDLPQFSLSVILNATNNFSNANKIGEGGFGPVYKGVLEGGQEIAVKRLSKESTQGIDEFTNEVIFIAKLQHRNLVRLLGCCIQGEENMLVYEYMQNNSLSSILFDESKGKLLDWKLRFNVIDGIARGLVYLHQDSRLRIIHRDLKASNILLDCNMNPKISDFGTAKTFRGNETEAKTRRVIGTYGYMSPEYAVDGLFSVKSDVFSFGVLVLEIVSGKKNRGYFHSDHSLNLLGHAWTLYKEGREVELVDASLRDTDTCLSEVLRSIHVGLLCVQRNPEDRPIMSSVILMLGNESMLIAQPKQPGFGFFTERDVIAAAADSNSMSSHAAYPTNGLTITMPEPR